MRPQQFPGNPVSDPVYIEGAEPAALDTLDFRKTRFDVLVVETSSALRSMRPNVTDKVIDMVRQKSGNAYRVDGVRGRNTWFVHRDFGAPLVAA